MLVTNDIILQAKRRLAALGNTPAIEDAEIDIAACLPSALSALARKVMQDDARRHLLQQDYTVTLDASGIGNLLAATGSITSTADILVDGVHWGVVRDADGNLLQPLKNYAAFLRPQPLVFDYYCLRGERIHTRSKQQQVDVPTDIQSVTGPLTVTANFEPKVCTVVPDELSDDLITELCAIVVGKLAAKSAPKNA